MPPIGPNPSNLNVGDGVGTPGTPGYGGMLQTNHPLAPAIFKTASINKISNFLGPLVGSTDSISDVITFPIGGPVLTFLAPVVKNSAGGLLTLQESDDGTTWKDVLTGLPLEDGVLLYGFTRNKKKIRLSMTATTTVDLCVLLIE